MSRKTIRGAVVAGTTALAVVGLAAPAQADSDSVYTTTGRGLMEYYDSTSDFFRIADFYDDEYGVRGEIRSGGGTLLSWSYFKLDESRYDSWTYDLAKGKSYVIRVCLAEGALDSTPINCASKVIHDD